MSATTESSQGRRAWDTWPHYQAAETGFRNYWYPVVTSRSLRNKKPKAITVLGENIMLLRDRGEVYALHDRCPHRGIPLTCGAGPLGQRSFARQNFPGTVSCGYHGWTYDLSSGKLVAALTDGPNSPIQGKVTVRNYPAAERVGLVWVYVGDMPAPPVEADIPERLLEEDHVRGTRVTIRSGNWRYAAENSMDEAHARYLHRNTPWTFFRKFPCWTELGHAQHDGPWLSYSRKAVHFEGEFEGLGKWPRHRPWQRRPRKPTRLRMRLPGTLEITWPRFNNYEWYVPIDADRHVYIQMAAAFKRGIRGALFKLRYWLQIRWLVQHAFNGQDSVMVAATDAPPERLFRPDATLIAWRQMCDEQARGA